MKSLLTLRYGKLILLIATLAIPFFLFSCGSNTGGAGGGGPITPNPPGGEKPVITVTGVTPTNRTLTYNGTLQPLNKATITFTVTGNTNPPKVNGQEVTSGTFMTPEIYKQTSITIEASNVKGTAEHTVVIGVVVDPTMAALEGRWIMTEKILNGVPYNMTCERDDTTSITVDGRFITTMGETCSGPNHSVWTSLSDDPSGKKRLIGFFDGQPIIDTLSETTFRLVGTSTNVSYRYTFTKVN
jgi:hypothetical protein